ncbi:hypothetical protein BKCO1_23000118 [Neofusicoccum parvum]|uniref:Uncharacterized protein n=1 Tax=Neofusicoccum parvum TaxID=310453 RepID=A0ACB5S124_9PEZI|nr:hypothetical protein BKCO1_23000118 [Neofusicoccum parvum]
MTRGTSREKLRDTGKKQLFGSLPSQDDRDLRKVRGNPNFSTLGHHSSSVESAEFMPSPTPPHTSQRSRARARERDYLQETEEDDEVPTKRKKPMPRSFKAPASHGFHRESSSYMSSSPSLTPPYLQHDTTEIDNTDNAPIAHHRPLTHPRPQPTTANRRVTSADDHDAATNDHSLFVTGLTPTPTDPTDTPTHRARLRALAGNPGAHPYARRKAPEADPENRLIKTLRQRARLHWDEIAARLNRDRVAVGRAPTFTTAAVYGRFQRVAPRIAEAEGEAGFDYKEYLHFKHERRDGGGRRRSPPIPKMSEEDLGVLARCYEEVERERWENVAKKFKLRAGFQLSAEQVAKKWNTL